MSLSQNTHISIHYLQNITFYNTHIIKHNFVMYMPIMTLFLFHDIINIKNKNKEKFSIIIKYLFTWGFLFQFFIYLKIYIFF